jgi:hypothetical protein
MACPDAAPPPILLAAASLLTLALAPPAAEAKRLRFKVVSIVGEQTATWHDSQEGCGVIARGTPGQRSPQYESCEYDGFHELDLIDSDGRLSQRRLTSRRRRTIRVKVSERVKEPTAESEGSQTTTLAATVALRRAR